MEQKETVKLRTICIDGDSITVPFAKDCLSGVWIGEYPFFKEEPRFTPSGRPWRNVSFTGCPHHESTEYNDCGTCRHLIKAEAKDLVGVCFCEKLRRPTRDVQSPSTIKEAL